MAEIVITRDGLERLSAELQHLTTAGRQEITERLRHAAVSEANQSENAEYLGVREDQALLERRIAVLEERLGSAQVVEPQPGNGRVDVGKRVRVRELESGARLELAARRSVGVERCIRSDLGCLAPRTCDPRSPSRPGRGGRRTARPASIQDPRPRDGLTTRAARGADDLPSRLAAERVRALAERHW